MKLEVTKYESGSGVATEEVNYFSELPRSVIGTIDLTDYLLAGGLSEISYATNKVDSDNGFYLEAGEVSLKCSNILDGWGSLGEYISLSETSLIEFFDFYNSSNKYFWKLQIWNDDRETPIWAGAIKRENISLSNRSDEIVNITAVSLDKEFSEYFSQKTLLGFDNFEVVTSVILNLTGLQLARLSNVIASNFPGVIFNFQSDGTHFVNNYYVADKSYIYAPLTTPLTNGSDTLVIKAGYDPFVLQEVDRFTWLHDVCKGMGWKLLFYDEKVIIEQRSSLTDTATTLDFNTDFIAHGVQSVEVTNIQTVIIEDGEYYGGNNSELEESTATNIIDEDEVYHYIGGNDAKVYSDVFDNVNWNTPFRRLFIPLLQYVRIFQEWIMFKEAPDSPANKQIFNQYLALDYNNPFQYQKLTANDSNTLRLDLVTNSSYPTSLDLTLPRTTNANIYGNGNSYSSAHDSGDNGIYMYGNPCHALIRFDTDLNRFETYEVYCNSEQFRKNFSTITGTGNKLNLDVTIDGVVNTIDSIYGIDNYPYKEIGGWRFGVTDVSIDLLNQTSNLKLVGDG